MHTFDICTKSRVEGQRERARLIWRYRSAHSQAMACNQKKTGIALIVVGLLLVIVGLVVGLLLPQVVQTTINDGVVCPQSMTADCFDRWQTNDESIRPITGSEHDPTRQYNDVYMFNITNKAAAMAGGPMELSQVGPYRYRLVYQYYNVLWDYALDTITYKEYRQMIPDDSSDPNGPLITQLSPSALRATYLGLTTFLNALILPQVAANPLSKCYKLTDVSTPPTTVEWDQQYQAKLFCRKEMATKYYQSTLSDPSVKGALGVYGGDFFVSLSNFLPPIIQGLIDSLGPQLMATAKALFVANVPTLVVGGFVTLINNSNTINGLVFVNEIVPLYTADMAELQKGNASVGGRIESMKSGCGSNPAAFDPSQAACAAAIAATYMGAGMAPMTSACRRAVTLPSQYMPCGLPGFSASNDLQSNQQCCLNQMRTSPSLVAAVRDAGLNVLVNDPRLGSPSTATKNKIVDVAKKRLFNTTSGAHDTLLPYNFAPMSANASSFFESNAFDLRPSSPAVCCAPGTGSFIATYDLSTEYAGDDAGRDFATTVYLSFLVEAFRAAFPSGLISAVAAEQGAGVAITWSSLLDAPANSFRIPRLFAYQLGTGSLTESTTYAESMNATNTSINNATYNIGFLANPTVQFLLSIGRNPARPSGITYLPFPSNFNKFEIGLRYPTSLQFDKNAEGLAKIYSIYKVLLSGAAALVLPEVGRYLPTLLVNGSTPTAATARVIAVWAAKSGYTVDVTEAPAFFAMVHKYLYEDLTPILRDWLHAGPGREFGLYMTRPISDWARGLKSDIYEGAIGQPGWCQPGFLTHHTGKNINGTHDRLNKGVQGGCISPAEGGDDATPNSKPNTNEYSYYTGKADITKVSQYAGIGKSTRTGRLQNGTGDAMWQYVNNWYYPALAGDASAQSLLKIVGHSGTQFIPAKKTFVLHGYTSPRVGEYEVFVTQADRHLNLVYTGNIKFKGITLNLFVADKDILKKDHRLNPQFFESVSIDGVSQIVDGIQTTEDSRGFPSWISRPYFVHGDSRLLAPFPALVAKLAADGNDAYDTMLGVEPITGASMYARKRLQGNIGVLPGMFSAYNVYNGRVNDSLVRRPIPYYWVNEWAEIPDPKVSAFKTKVYTTSTAAYGVLIALPTAGLLIIILGIYLLLTARRPTKATESSASFAKSGVGAEVANPLYSK